LDEVEEPQRPVNEDFMMSVDGTFIISGRGLVATGLVEQGKAKVGETVDVLGLSEDKITTTITGIETFQKSLDNALAGDNVGLLLRGMKKNDVKRGQVIAKSGKLKTCKKFMANC